MAVTTGRNTGRTTGRSTGRSTGRTAEHSAAARRLPLRQAFLGAIVLAVLGLVVAVPLARDDDQVLVGPIDPASLVPSIGPVTGREMFGERLSPVPPAGTVARVAGPFDGNVALQVSRLSAAGPPAVSGTVQVVSEVSTLLVLKLRAGWYDADGALLGTTDLVLRQPDFTRAYQAGRTASLFNGRLPFRIAVPPGLAGPVASASLALPSLVNE